jgi:hypothetical protein
LSIPGQRSFRRDGRLRHHTLDIVLVDLKTNQERMLTDDKSVALQELGRRRHLKGSCTLMLAVRHDGVVFVGTKVNTRCFHTHYESQRIDNWGIRWSRLVEGDLKRLRERRLRAMLPSS